MVLTASEGVGWSDWVIRLPGGGDSPEGFLVPALLGLLVLFGLMRVLFYFLDRTHHHVRGLLIVAVLALIFVAVRDAVDRQEGNVQHEIGVEDCSEQFIDRCPRVTTEDPEGG